MRNSNPGEDILNLKPLKQSWYKLHPKCFIYLSLALDKKKKKWRETEWRTKKSSLVLRKLTYEKKYYKNKICANLQRHD